MTIRELPSRTDMRQLKIQAKELLRAARRGDVHAAAEFRAHHPDAIDCQAAKLSDAQLVLARSYGAPSWPQLVFACRLLRAIDLGDDDAIRDLATDYFAPFAARGVSHALAWHARPTDAANAAFRRVVGMLLERGVRPVSSAVARPELRPWVTTMRMLSRLGARPPRDALMGAVETLNARDFDLMLDLSPEIADSPSDWRALVALALTTYARNPNGKHQVLESMAQHGISLPDTPPMAVHRGRVDLLETHLRRDPKRLFGTFALEEIYPTDFGCGPGDAFFGAPLDGATLLHLAIDYGELDIARWLLERGMNPNARAARDDDGYGGHTPLFSCVVSYAWYLRSKYASPKPVDDPFAELLLDASADVRARATLRSSTHADRLHEYRHVTPLAWGQQYHARELVSSPAMQLVAARAAES